jgi:acyl-coenzyme A thioesterase PaaI-like protein
MQADKKTARTKQGLREYTCLGCPLTRNRTAWCFRLCAPDAEGNGRCGRIAPHGLKGRTLLGIEDYSKNLLEAHCRTLERLYLAAPCNEYYDPGVRISAGEAEIVISIREALLSVAGAVHASVCFTAMVDSAVLAVNSVVEKALVVALDFDIHFTGLIATGELVARSRFVGMSGKHYLAESVLTNSEGREVGRGSGTFMESDVSLAQVT